VRDSAQLAGGLHRLGFRRGDVLAVWLPNSPEWLLLYEACQRLGVAVAAVNTRYRAAELGQVRRASRARGLVFAPGFNRIDFSTSLAGLEGRPEHWLALGDRPCGRPVADQGRPGEAGAIFTAAGTTASAKLAAHTQGALKRHASEVARFFDVREGDVVVLSLPLAGVFGLNTALAALAGGARLVMQELFQADEAAELMGEHGAQHFNGSDAMVKAVLDSPRFRPTGRWRRSAFANFTGLNRVSWDLREDGPTRWEGAAKEEYRGPRIGAAVVPGTYVARVTLAGKTFSQPVRVEPDPRVQLTAADFRAAYGFAKKHLEAYSRLNATLNRLDAYAASAAARTDGAAPELAAQ